MFIVPVLVFLSLSIAFPLFKVFQYSFQKYSPQSNSLIFVGLEQYRHLFSDHLFWISVKNAFLFTISTMILHLGLSYLVALLLNAKWPEIRLRNFFRGILILPYLFSAPAAALLWGILYQPLGYLNYISEQLFGTIINFLGDPKLALLSVVFVNGWASFPIFMVLILGGLQSIPKSTYEAAQIDGANRFQSFWYVTLPQMRSLTMTVILIDFACTFIHFDLVWTMTRGGPLYSTYLVSFFLYERGIQQVRLGYGAAVGVIITLIMCACIAIYVVLYSKRLEVE